MVAGHAAGNTQFPLPLRGRVNYTRRLWLCFHLGKEYPLLLQSANAHSNGNYLTRARASVCSERHLKHKTISGRSMLTNISVQETEAKDSCVFKASSAVLGNALSQRCLLCVALGSCFHFTVPPLPIRRENGISIIHLS